MKDGLADGSENSSRHVPSPGRQRLDAPPLSQDNLFDALSSRRSRYVLITLKERDDPIGIDDLADTVAEWETGKPIDLVSEEHCERVVTSLRHSQLPKLSMMGIAEYDEEESVVARGPYAEQADPYLEIAARRDENVEL